MAEYKPNIDYNDDGIYNSLDFDIAWAALQANALAGIGAIEPATNAEMIAEVQTIYDVNQASGIATKTSKKVADLPFDVENLVAAELLLEHILGYWRMNEGGIGELFDSSEHERHTAELVKGNHLEVPSATTRNGVMLVWNTNIMIADPDGKLFSADNDFTLHMKVWVKDRFRFKISKGSQKMFFAKDVIFKLPTWARPFKDYAPVAEKSVDVYFVKKGETVSLFIKKAGETTSIVDKKTIKAAAAFSADTAEPIVINGHGATPANACKISEVYVLSFALDEADMLTDFYAPPRFRFLLDGTDFEETGKLIEGEEELKLPVATSKIKNAGHATGVPDIVKGKDYLWWKGANHLQYDGFDFTEDFTLSFWAKSDYNQLTQLVKIEKSDDASRFFKLDMTKAEGNEIRVQLKNVVANVTVTGVTVAAKVITNMDVTDLRVGMMVADTDVFPTKSVITKIEADKVTMSKVATGGGNGKTITFKSTRAFVVQKPKTDKFTVFLGKWIHYVLVQTYGKLELYVNGKKVDLAKTLQLNGRTDTWKENRDYRGSMSVPHTLSEGMDECKLFISKAGTPTGVRDISLIRGGAVRVDANKHQDDNEAHEDTWQIDALYNGSYFA